MKEMDYSKDSEKKAIREMAINIVGSLKNYSIDEISVLLNLPINYLRELPKEDFEDLNVQANLKADFENKTIRLIEDEYMTKGRVTNTTIQDVMYRTGNHKKYQMFMWIYNTYPMTEAALRNGFREAWIMGRCDDYCEAWDIFNRIGLERILSAKEKVLYAKLPNVVTIYRGSHKDEAIHEKETFDFSWTLSREVAEFFAFRGVHFNAEDGRVYSVRIRKSNMMALFLDRDEFEVIHPSICRSRKSFKIVTDRPTEYFARYMDMVNKKLDDLIG